MVPIDWEHPKTENGKYDPLFKGSYSNDIGAWIHSKEMWNKGFYKDYFDGWRLRTDKEMTCSYEGYECNAPQWSDYMPEWDKSEKTHYQMYETCSEGTPISPVLDTPEHLARWLVENGASSFGAMTATYDQWLGLIKSGNESPCAVARYGEIKSGVAVYGEDAK